MRPVWKGALTFGPVTIPVGLCPATTRGDLSFRLLHATDKSPIADRRVCSEENVEVPWAEIVKGYEDEKGQLVVMTDADFEPPYDLEPPRTGATACALLRTPARSTMRFAREIVAPAGLDRREVDLALQLADTLAGPWEPAKCRDRDREARWAS